VSSLVTNVDGDDVVLCRECKPPVRPARSIDVASACSDHYCWPIIHLLFLLSGNRNIGQTKPVVWISWRNCNKSMHTNVL